MEPAVLASNNSLDGQQDARRELVVRVTKSQCFRNSARMREFLLYVSDCVLRDAAGEATEQQIGIHVFGRLAGYNSSEDSIVRTHARLLRQKLTEYFAVEGAQETLVLEIPKGHYLPCFHERSEQFKQPSRTMLTIPDASGQIGTGIRAIIRPLILWKLVALLAVLAVSVPVALSWWRTTTATNRSAVDKFWKPFMTDNSSLVIYSNALFIGDSTNGLKYAAQQNPGAKLNTEPLVDTYTGIGELAGVYELTKLFDSHQASFRLKRSLLVAWDDAKFQNLIFIGSVAENPSLRDVTSTTDFTLTTGNGFSGIVNHHPKPGELPLYSVPLYSPTKDYAILAFLPGLQLDKHMLIFSGLTTMGTQAAVDFTCHQNTLQVLMQKATNQRGEIRPFEAVLETKIGGGVPLQTRLVTLHVH
jgi:hypothetical protein